MTQLDKRSGHAEIIELLPWYVNDTLDDVERNIVARHIGTCPECQESVELLSQVERMVRTESPTPLVPAPRIQELFDTIDQPGIRNAWYTRWQTIAPVAAVMAVAVIVSIVILERQTDVDSPGLYETATSPAATSFIDYVIELELVPGTDAAARKHLFDAIDAREFGPSEHPDGYRATVRLDRLSLVELERYIDDVESRPEIATAEIVAVQLPVE